MDTPILFIIFNRPDTTQRVFNEIKKMKPKFLFITADGPRNNINGEKEKCEETRSIIDQIDWDCKVSKHFSNINLGCKIGVSSGIDWFFDNVEEGIILEDDCLPNESFFYFCKEMLKKYRFNKDIMHISGTNLQDNISYGDGSYFFSNIVNIWGWATWKRAWSFYDKDIKKFSSFLEENKIKYFFKKRKYQRYWISLFRAITKNKIDTWDAQWQFAIFKNNGISINPNKNLISNIGFGQNATHTKEFSKESNMPIETIKKIINPKKIILSKNADNYQMRKKTLTFKEKVIKKIKDYSKKTNLTKLQLIIKKIIPKKIRSAINQSLEVLFWFLKGKPVPAPSIIKRRIIKKIAKKYKSEILVETGTYLGDTVDYFKNKFDQIFSIELDNNLYINAQNRFKKYKHIQIIKGDSGELLPSILKNINKPVIFWLDGHYSAGITAKSELNTPIIKELNGIFDNINIDYVILIDDARYFIGENDYPTIEKLKEHILQKENNLNWEINNDIIIITPKN